MDSSKSSRVQKWVLSIGVLLVGVGLIWANATSDATDRIRKGANATCERDVADRKINQAAHRRVAAAMRVVAASSDDPTLISEFNAAADRMTVLALSLDPLINVSCEDLDGNPIIIKDR
jgi:hypothetical protein